MKSFHPSRRAFRNAGALNTELLILPDGRILVQNLTQPMADVLSGLNPNDDTIRARAKTAAAGGSK